MRIFVKVQTKAKIEKVERLSEECLRVWVKPAPKAGKANKALVESLAKYFKVSKSNVKILAGLGSKNKIVEVGEGRAL